MTTQPSSFSVGNVSANTVQRHPKHKAASIAQKPLFGSVSVSGEDQIQFGSRDSQSSSTASHRGRVDDSEEASGVGSASSRSHSDETSRPKPQPTTPPKKEYGRFQNNLRMGLGIILSDIVPIALSLPMVAGPLGFVVALACVPASYISGKLGRWVTQDVNRKNLNPVFSYVQEVRDIFSGKPPAEGEPESAVGRLNKAVDNLLDLRSGSLAWIIGTLGLKDKLKLSASTRLGTFIERFTKQKSLLLRAQVNIKVAGADGIGQATMAAGKGLAEYTFFNTLNKLGTRLANINFAPAQWLGRALQSAGILHMGYEIFHGSGNSQTRT